MKTRIVGSLVVDKIRDADGIELFHLRFQGVEAGVYRDHQWDPSIQAERVTLIAEGETENEAQAMLDALLDEGGYEVTRYVYEERWVPE